MSAAEDQGAAVAAPEENVRLEPYTHTSTPSGIEIDYFVEPKRKYEVRALLGDPQDDTFTPWIEVPSVTTVLGCLDKPALPWWGMKIGAQGVIELNERGLLTTAQDGKIAVAINGAWLYATPENVCDLLNREKLTVNHVRDKAGDRGQATHDAFEAWAALGTLPNPDAQVEDEEQGTRFLYPEEERGYVEGLRKFCVDIGDAWTTGGVEIAVASVEHEFAGRYDLRGEVTRDVKLVTKATTQRGEPLKRGPKYTVVPGGTKGLVDLKTSKGIYGTHLMQLEAYEGGGIECGYDPTDWRAVLHVTADGLYEFKRAKATYDDFLAIRHTYAALERVKGALK
jgi:hypothetical protein